MKLLILTLVLLVFLVPPVLAAIGSSRSDVKALSAVELPERIMPGQPLPPDAYCYWEHWSTPYLYCRAGDAYVAFDQAKGVISRATLSPRAVTFGELLLAWGTPTGETRMGYSKEVQWGNRSAFVSGRGEFGPSSEVLFVAYSLEPQAAGPWRGFVEK